jgi:hypothetical protein
MTASYITIDNGSIINLFASGGEEAWDQLLVGDRKLIIPEFIL